jgi:hypothetical protein
MGGGISWIDFGSSDSCVSLRLQVCLKLLNGKLETAKQAPASADAYLTENC